MKELLEVITKIYDDEELRNTCIPLFMSNSGIGKTTIITKFIESKGKKCLPVIASTKMPHEFAGMAIPDNTTKQMVYFDYDELLNLEDGDCLFLDEMLNANPMILNAFLTVLEDRVLPSGKKLKNILIVAAANPHGAAILTPQVKQRFIWYPLKFDKSAWKQYMSKYLITNEIFEQLCILIQNETFTSSEHNFYTPRSIEKAIKMMIKDVPTPYSTKLKPILETKILNTYNTDVILKSGKIFKKGELMPWLELMQDKI